MNHPIEIVLGWKASHVPAGGIMDPVGEPRLYRFYDAVARIAPSRHRNLVNELELLDVGLGQMAFNAVVREGTLNALPFNPYRILDDSRWPLDSRMGRHFDMLLRSANVYKPPWGRGRT